MKTNRISAFCSILLLALQLAFPVRLPAQISAVADAPCANPWPYNSPSLSSNLSQYDCDFSGNWPTCEAVEIPVFGLIAQRSDGSGPNHRSHYLDAVNTLKNGFAGTGFTFRSIGFRYVPEDELFTVDASQAGQHIHFYGHPYALNLFIADDISYEDPNQTPSTVYANGTAAFPWQSNLGFFVKRARVNDLTVVHEMGHTLGLLHTHSNALGIEAVVRPGEFPGNCVNCETTGDLLCDTDADYPNARVQRCVDKDNFFGLCWRRYRLPMDNYMSYYGSCRNRFTQGQIDRMKCFYNRHYKEKLGDPSTNLTHFYDFEGGYEDFLSDYVVGGPGTAGNTLNIGTTPTQFHSSWINPGDHTSGSGNMLIVNGAPTTSARIIYKTIDVKPYTWYRMEAWGTALYHSNIPGLLLRVDGQNITDGNGQLNAQAGVWKKVQGYWFSGYSCEATISVSSSSTAFVGNDFAVDDVYFVESIPPNLIVPLSHKAPTAAPEISAPDLRLFPNPAQEYCQLQVEVATESDISYTILDLQGQQVFRQPALRLPVGRSTLRWDRPAGLSKGMYLVKIQLGDQVQTQRLVLQ